MSGGSPQFGQFASPEDQAARSGRPAAQPVDPALVPQDAPVFDTTQAPAAGGASAPAGARLADRIVTIALLAYGLFNTIGSFAIYADPSSILDVLGVDVELTDYAAIRTLGIIATVVVVAGWLGTAALCWWRLAKRRSAWWIALLAGVVFNFVGSLLITIPLVQDSAVMDALLNLSGAS